MIFFNSKRNNQLKTKHNDTFLLKIRTLEQVRIICRMITSSEMLITSHLFYPSLYHIQTLIPPLQTTPHAHFIQEEEDPYWKQMFKILELKQDPINEIILFFTSPACPKCFSIGFSKLFLTKIKILTVINIPCSINNNSFHMFKKTCSHNSDQLFVIRFYFPSFTKFHITENDK